MGNVCICQETSAVDQNCQSNFFQTSLPLRSKFHSIAASELKEIKNDRDEKNNQIKQSAINIQAPSLHQSSNHPSFLKNNQLKYQLIVDPPSEYNQEMLRNLQNMSQVPSCFFNNPSMSVYFRDNKSQKSKISKKLSQLSSKEGPKISIQSKHSRQDDFESLRFIKNEKNAQEKDAKKLNSNLIIDQNIRLTRSKLIQKDETVLSSERQKSTTKSMIRLKVDSSIMTQDKLKQPQIKVYAERKQFFGYQVGQYDRYTRKGRS